MRFDEADVIVDRPGAATFYAGSLVGSAFVFLMLLALFFVASLWSGSSIAIAMSVLIFGGLWGGFISILLAFLVVGPIGTAIGVALARLAPPGKWHGATNGAATGVILLALVLTFTPGATRNLDVGTQLFAVAFLLAGAIAGWMVQSWYLCWPVRPE